MYNYTTIDVGTIYTYFIQDATAGKRWVTCPHCGFCYATHLPIHTFGSYGELPCPNCNNTF